MVRRTNTNGAKRSAHPHRAVVPGTNTKGARKKHTRKLKCVRKRGIIVNGDFMKKIQQIEIYERDRYVVKANELIQKSRFNLTLQQQKIVLYLISQIERNDKEFKLYSFSIQQFCKVCGINYTSGKNYNDLKEAIKEIAQKVLWIKLPNGKETTVRWIEKAYIDRNTGTIEIRLDEDMKPYLLQLRDNFTQYELVWTLQFNSKYSIRLYELIKSIHYHDLDPYERTYDIDELKRLLDAETYKTYQHFKDRALQVAVDEINSTSDKLVSFVPIKDGRAVKKIQLHIESKDQGERIKLRKAIEQDLGSNQVSMWEMLDELYNGKRPD